MKAMENGSWGRGKRNFNCIRRASEGFEEKFGVLKVEFRRKDRVTWGILKRASFSIKKQDLPSNLKHKKNGPNTARILAYWPGFSHEGPKFAEIKPKRL